MKIAIVGSRDYPNLHIVRHYVEVLPDNTIIISGGAHGVDATAAEAARKRGLPVIEHKPNWKPNGVYDASAGFKRNAYIVNDCDVLVAFWHNESKGTAHSIRLAKYSGKPIIVFDGEGKLLP